MLGEPESQYRCYQKESCGGHQTPQDLHIKNAQRAIKQDLRTAEETANLRFSFKRVGTKPGVGHGLGHGGRPWPRPWGRPWPTGG